MPATPRRRKVATEAEMEMEVEATMETEEEMEEEETTLESRLAAGEWISYSQAVQKIPSRVEIGSWTRETYFQLPSGEYAPVIFSTDGKKIKTKERS